MKRIFIGIGIDPGKEYRKAVASVKNELSDEKIKWTEENNIHITLSFLGNTEDHKIPVIESILKDTCLVSHAFELTIKGLGVFRGLKDPKVLWAGIEPSEKLTSLQASITEYLRKNEFQVDEKPFSPHVTIGRIRHINDTDRLKTILLKYHSRELQRAIIREVVLFESILRQEGPVYVPLSKFDLIPAL
ncbi:MAG TPA: RNA 2',3'-cyclic phosphodiesterase [Bacteroidales bacterium]|nr:RNA 2',3'-cyclic phosphodiesterase [Bacteroidales bacterium]